MAEAGRPTTGAHLLEMARGYQPAALLIGLVELDICTALAKAGQVGLSVQELAARQGLSPRPLEALLQAATALGLLKAVADRYVNTALAAEYLARGGQHYLGAQISTQADQYRGWLALPQAVREGRTVLPNLQSVGGASDDPVLRRLLLGLHRGGQGLLPLLTPLLDPYLKTAGRLLDVGSGVGTFGMGWAEGYGGLEVSLLDRPGVIELAHEVGASSPALARVQFWPGDYREVDFGREIYDLVLFFQVLRTESPALIRQLIGKAARALTPGGHIAIYDSWLEPDRAGPLENVFQNLTMSLMYEEGRLFSAPELTDWLTEAGLHLLQSWPIAVARPMVLYLAGRA